MKVGIVAFLLSTVLIACGGVSEKKTEETNSRSRDLFEVDLKSWEESAPKSTQQAPGQSVPEERRRTGEIKRAQLDRVIANGPGYFLRQVELEPERAKGKFVGHRILRVSPGPLQSVDAVVGDVVLSVNDLPIGTPSDMQRLWESLRTAVVIRATVQRADQQHELVYRVVE